MASSSCARDPVDDMYAGWVMSVLMTHRQLLVHADAINEGNKDKYGARRTRVLGWFSPLFLLLSGWSTSLQQLL
jgi:hypothetical protein